MSEPSTRAAAISSSPTCDAALARVRELGGDVTRHDPSDDPETVARFALRKDDQGSSFGLHQGP